MFPDITQAADAQTNTQNLATECEIEEEYLVNNLQKRIGKLHLEKGQLEQSLSLLQRKVKRDLHPRLLSKLCR